MRVIQKKKTGTTKFLLAGLMVILQSPAFAKVTLPSVFSNGMVLQQKTAASIWGRALPGEEIAITTSWSKQTVRTKADASGKWTTTLQTPSAGGPYDIRIKGQNTVDLHDVLIGEVWVCSGQSNMVFSLKSAYKAREEIAAANYPSIRYFSIKRQYGPKEFDNVDSSSWVNTSPQVAGGFSAVAYFFARKLHQQKGVPVGLIYAAWGGTPAEAWTPSSVLKTEAVLNLYNLRWADMFKTVGKDSTAYHVALEAWEAKQKTADSNKTKKPQEPATLISFNRPWREPSVLFNGMIRPVIPFSIKGVLWYQGESNVSYADEYKQLFGAMIKGWRQQFNNASLPFYFVQIAPFEYSDMEAAARLRNAQQQVADTIFATAMVTTVDVGNMKDQHPTRKKEVGERLAVTALNKLYGENELPFTGPAVKSTEVQNEKLQLVFDKTLTTNDGRPPAGFEIGYKLKDSMVFVPARAAIAGNTSTVWSDGVTKPIVVRYAWVQIGQANVGGTDGLPVAPFIKSITQQSSKHGQAK